MTRVSAYRNYGKHEAAYRYAYNIRFETLNQVRFILKVARSI